MFEAFPSMKPQFAQMQGQYEPILPESKPDPMAEQFDIALQSFFDKEEEETETTTQIFKHIYDHPFQRLQFYELFRKALNKILKRELKKIEELINHHSRSPEQTELNRIKLDKILRECMFKIEQSSELMHEFIEDFETYQQLNCNCKKQVCEERQSFEQFLVDIFGFFVRSSQLFNRQLEYAAERKVSFSYKFDRLYYPKMKQDWKYGNKPGQVIIQIEKDCQKAKSKKQKRKQNRKNKTKPSEDITILEINQEDKQENTLNNFLQNLKITNERQPCIVTEDCLKKIAHKYGRK